MFDAYLDCYSFPRTVLGGALTELERNKPGASFKWPEEALRQFHSDPRSAAIGVPQGGAVSALIANCLLHRADCELRQLNCDDTFTYLRYCDDMIILSPSRSTCRRAFRTYCAILAQLMLPIHQPRWTGRYGAAFWEGKSRPVYRWARPFLWFKRSPWIQFVGYQIRFDGLLRIRKSSFKKHIKKIVDAVDELLAHVKPATQPAAASSTPVRKTVRQITHRLKMRLISIAVGRRELHTTPDAPLPMSWCAGFECLHNQPFLSAQLKALDRHRERQMCRLERALRGPILATTAGSVGQKAPALKFYGRPFSYFGQFRRIPLATERSAN